MRDGCDEETGTGRGGRWEWKLGQRNGISNEGSQPVLTDVYHRLKVFGDSPRYPAEKAALFYARYVLSGINFPSKGGGIPRFVDLRMVDLVEK